MYDPMNGSGKATSSRPWPDICGRRGGRWNTRRTLLTVNTVQCPGLPGPGSVPDSAKNSAWGSPAFGYDLRPGAWEILLTKSCRERRLSAQVPGGAASLLRSLPGSPGFPVVFSTGRIGAWRPG